jgi:hypothetical protein
MPYTAVVLTEESKLALRLRTTSVTTENAPNVVVKCHHMTCDMKPAAKSIAAGFVGQEVELEVVRVGYLDLPDVHPDAHIVAAEVTCCVPSKNAIKHITLYHHESVKPVKSNDITHWLPPPGGPFTIRGVVQEVQ